MKFEKVLANDFRIELIVDGHDSWTYQVFQNGLNNVQPMYERKYGRILPVALIEILDRIEYHFDISFKDKFTFVEEILKDIGFLAGTNECINWIKEEKDKIPYKKEQFIYGYCAENKNIVFHQICLNSSMYDKVGEGWYDLHYEFNERKKE